MDSSNRRLLMPLILLAIIGIMFTYRNIHSIDRIDGVPQASPSVKYAVDLIEQELWSSGKHIKEAEEDLPDGAPWTTSVTGLRDLMANTPDYLNKVDEVLKSTTVYFNLTKAVIREVMASKIICSS